jgi:Cu/Ag efflux pump CusA
MAWTVAFALLGALVFSMVLAPVLSSFLFRRGAREWRNPILTWLIDGYKRAAAFAIRNRYLTVGFAGLPLHCRRIWRSAALSVRNFFAPGRGLRLGTRNAGAEHRA